MLDHLQSGRHLQALEVARALSEHAPHRGLPWKVMGALLWARGDAPGAVHAMQQSARLLPQDAEAHCNLGLTLAKLDRFAEAESCLRAAIRIDPRFSLAHYRLGMVFELQGRLDEAEDNLRRGLALHAAYTEAEDPQNHSNLLFIMSHNPAVSAEALLEEHLRYGRHVGEKFEASWPRHTHLRDPERCLKVGFVSGDLYEHSVGQFLEPILAALAQHQTLHLHAYCANPQVDALQARLQSHFKSWTIIEGLPDAALADRIRNDGIDVLVDLSGHTGHNRLPVFARKPAPLQLSWLGYPGTTGLRAMDYYLADRGWLPPGRFDHLFSEQLLYLPDRWAFKPHAAAPSVSPLPALQDGRLTFGSFHRFGKINPSTLALWAHLLHALPEATLRLVGIRLDEQKASLLAQFAAHGIDSARLTVQGRSTMDLYLASHQHVDIALDAMPYAGATTTMHSLSMGVPTLTLTGDTAPSRACAGILANLKLERFSAEDTQGFIDNARYWAAHLPELAALRADLRNRLAESPGGQPALIAAHLERALRHLWQRWCQNLPPKSFDTAALDQALPDRTILNGAPLDRTPPDTQTLHRTTLDHAPPHGTTLDGLPHDRTPLDTAPLDSNSTTDVDATSLGGAPLDSGHFDSYSTASDAGHPPAINS